MRSFLTVVNSYDLRGSADDFSVAIAALVRRVEAEGHRGILGYRFFLNPQAAVARAVIDYADPAAWIGHHELAMDWPEMKALHRVATLRHVTFLGPLTDEIAAWLAGSGLTADVESGFGFTAGFERI